MNLVDSAAHEAAHVAALHLLGRQIDSVRLFDDGSGLTVSRGARDEAYQASLLVAIIAEPGQTVTRFRCEGDLRQAQAIGPTDRASDHARAMLCDPRFRLLQTDVASELLLQRHLGGDDLKAILARSTV